jgi:hypothetical protein
MLGRRVASTWPIVDMASAVTATEVEPSFRLCQALGPLLPQLKIGRPAQPVAQDCAVTPNRSVRSAIWLARYFASCQTPQIKGDARRDSHGKPRK